MNRRTSFALAATAMLLTASLAVAQGYPKTTGAGGAKPAAAGTRAAVVTTGAPAAQAKPAAAGKPAAGPLVDLNSASKADLMKLPGIGEAISAKIVAGRPWVNKGQLLSKGLVTKPAYDKLSALVIAKQAK